MTLQKKSNPRRVAWDVLNQVGQQDGWIEDFIEQRLQRSTMSTLDQRLCRELCFGVVKMQAYLDHNLDTLLKDPTKTELKLRMLLRLGAYQLLCLDKIPKHAAVHETVEIAKKILPTNQIKMINAILREITRRPLPVYPDPSASPQHYLQIRYSFPEYIVSRWFKRFGLENTETMLAQSNASPPLIARVNGLKGSTEQALGQLNSQGIEAHPGNLPMAIVFDRKTVSPADILEKNPGWFYFQDQASQLVGWLIDPPSQAICLDVCAAPGGKATHVAELLKNRGCVQAYDISSRRRKKIVQNCNRLGLTNITVLSDLESAQQSDRVWVDAPCSGLGTLRRHVETRWRMVEKDHQRLAKMQLQILQQAAKFVKPSGHLIYITCTTEPEENEAVVHAFLHDNPQFEILSGPGREAVPSKKYWNEDGFFRTFPNSEGMDAMFAARLVYKA